MKPVGRTSQDHPLEIAELDLPRAAGLVGITLCPGKIDPDAATGGWQRDLGLDLDRARDWGAALVVTLTEAKELSRLGVPHLGTEVGRRHMGWLHLPIVDAEAPDALFEAGWPAASRRIHGLLAQGFHVLLHCKGGLGRAGTVAAHLAVEHGMPAERAIAAVRAVRPGAIETAVQEAHVRRAATAVEAAPSRDADAIEDRAVGCLLGLAIGDALGTTVEFRRATVSRR
jgi:ADP-ribosyl-[dinitrogen reductase] hydrolase